MGHEFMGEVVEVGDAVTTLQKGDRVVSGFTTSWYVSSTHGYGPWGFGLVLTQSQWQVLLLQARVLLAL